MKRRRGIDSYVGRNPKVPFGAILAQPPPPWDFRSGNRRWRGTSYGLSGEEGLPSILALNSDMSSGKRIRKMLLLQAKILPTTFTIVDRIDTRQPHAPPTLLDFPQSQPTHQDDGKPTLSH
jgi:hypothetical protein